MSTAIKTPFSEAYAVAIDLMNRLDRACDRLLIAGSIRRQKPEIGDIELVVLPRMEPVTDLFGENVPGLARSALDDALAQLGELHYTRNGERYKQFEYEGRSIDLFIATPETWGCVATIRTGSADFSKWLVTARKYGGACPSHLHFKDGRIWNGASALETPGEHDVFAALGIEWIEPAERREGRWR